MAPEMHIPKSSEDFFDRPQEVLLLDQFPLTVTKASGPPVLLVCYGPQNSSLLLLLPILYIITTTDLVKLYI